MSAIDRDHLLCARLNRHPRLRARVESLLEIVEDAAGDCEKAGAAECRGIDALRQMGHAVLTAQAEGGIEKRAAVVHTTPDWRPGGGVKALLPQVLPPLPLLPAGSWVSVIDGSSCEAPGADSTDDRLHLQLERVSLTFVKWVVTAVHTAASLRPFTLGVGGIALVDRGYCQPAARVETHPQGADWRVRWNRGMPLWTPPGEEFDGVTTLQHCR